MGATEVPARVHSGLAGVLRDSFEELAEEEVLGTIWGPGSMLCASGLSLQISATQLEVPFFSRRPATQEVGRVTQDSFRVSVAQQEPHGRASCVSRARAHQGQARQCAQAWRAQEGGPAA